MKLFSKEKVGMTQMILLAFGKLIPRVPDEVMMMMSARSPFCDTGTFRIFRFFSSSDAARIISRLQEGLE